MMSDSCDFNENGQDIAKVSVRTSGLSEEPTLKCALNAARRGGVTREGEIGKHDSALCSFQGLSSENFFLRTTPLSG